MDNMRVHPEVHKEVYTKFRELFEKNPGASGDVLWAMARDYVYALQYSETELIKLEYGLL